MNHNSDINRVHFRGARSDLFKKLSLGRSHPDIEAVKRFNRATRDATNMSHYQNLLFKAVAATLARLKRKVLKASSFAAEQR